MFISKMWSNESKETLDASLKKGGRGKFKTVSNNVNLEIVIKL